MQGLAGGTTPMDEHDQTDITAGMRARPLVPGLYLVSTPIGAARDITLRALDILASADVLAAEDTRTLRHLMEIHGIKPGGRPLLAYHDHNGAEARPRILRALAEGKSVAYASEAGTPMVADAGYQLVRAVIEAGLPVTAAPGPSAAIMALSLSGLPSDRFLFAGFPPAPAGARARWLDEIGTVPATLILYESPKRINRLLGELCERWGDGRDAALCRELTKRFEEVRRGTLGSLRDALAGVALKGEIALVVGRPLAVVADAADVDAALRAALGRLRVKEAAAEVAETLGLARRDVYQRALALKDGDGDGR
jgi:16S rRNA (cytidine1402-2'-O)-methyltransferase